MYFFLGDNGKTSERKLLCSIPDKPSHRRMLDAGGFSSGGPWYKVLPIAILAALLFDSNDCYGGHGLALVLL
jgi:hypothetical protein